jgi:hypothetical protein
LWGVALPFIAVGVWLTLRRLVDARLPLWFVALFFVPFANLIFFLAVAAAEPRPADPSPAIGYRMPVQKPVRAQSMATGALMGGTAGAVVALGMLGISVGLFRDYGAALFLGAPTISAFVATMVYGRMHGPQVGPSFLAALLALMISFAVMILFALEGIVCLIMAAPLALIAATVGWALGYVCIHLGAGSARRTTPAALSVLPLWVVAEALSPAPPEPERMVESVVEIDAPRAAVWERVLAFEELPPPTELLFRAGVSAPTGATIIGEGVGAVRRCRFTTGEFVEPITVWDAPRELSFDVRQQPDPMRELTPYPGPRPPHLDGYFATTRGQFLLESLPGGRTRLRGRTWYRLRVFPRAYWSLWAEPIIHTIHLRVMKQIALLAERDTH